MGRGGRYHLAFGPTGQQPSETGREVGYLGCMGRSEVLKRLLRDSVSATASVGTAPALTASGLWSTRSAGTPGTIIPPLGGSGGRKVGKG